MVQGGKMSEAEQQTSEIEVQNKTGNKTGGASRGFGQRLAIGLSSAVCILLFQNCGTDFVPLDDAALSGLGKFVCGSTLQETYGKTYQKFAQQNCVSCHGGAQSPKFALADPALAYSEFIKTTQSNFRTYALNPSHGGAAGGPEHEAEVAKSETNFNSCKSDGGDGDGGVVITVRTQPLPLTATAALQVRIFNNLSGQLQLGSTNIGAAQLDFQVRVDTTINPPAYIIARPRLQTGTLPLRVKSMFVMINGVRIPTATAFMSIDRTLAANTTLANGTLATGSAIFEYPGAVPGTDTVQFEFEILQAQ
jgi:hypothetical protein